MQVRQFLYRFQASFSSSKVNKSFLPRLPWTPWTPSIILNTLLQLSRKQTEQQRNVGMIFSERIWHRYFHNTFSSSAVGTIARSFFTTCFRLLAFILFELELWFFRICNRFCSGTSWNFYFCRSRRFIISDDIFGHAAPFSSQKCSQIRVLRLIKYIFWLPQGGGGCRVRYGRAILNRCGYRHVN